MAVLAAQHSDLVSPLTASSSSESKDHNDNGSSIAPWDLQDTEKQPANGSGMVSSSSGSSGSSSSVTARIVAWQVRVMRWALFATNLLTWYWSNGMNGIAMQSFASRVRQSNAPSSAEDNATTSFEPASHGLAFYVAVTSFVTALQLLLGAIVGSGLLLLLFHASGKQQQLRSPRPFYILSLVSSLLHRKKKPSNQQQHFSNNEWFLSSLHGLGSLTTNLGFMYGTAYLVQIIKLLEPLETLLLSAYFGKMMTITTNAPLAVAPTSTSSTVCRVGLVCSIVVVIGSAMSLVQWKQTSQSNTQVAAIFFALVSGCTLSLRNVFQQKQHAAAAAAMPAPSLSRSQSLMAGGSEHDGDQGHGKGAKAATNAAATATIPSSLSEQEDQTNNLQLSKLERSVMQFTKLSLQSGLVMAAFSLLFTMLCLASPAALMAKYYNDNDDEQRATTLDAAATLQLLWQSLTWNVVTWHPMYNVTSMIVLGFCGSAVTHSLFNAGKRVFSILIALLWMEQQQQQQAQQHAHQSLASTSGSSKSTTTYFRLFMVAVGAIWYTLETKQPPPPARSSSNNNSNSNNNSSRWHDLLQASSSSANSSLPTTTMCGATKTTPATMIQLSKVVICVAMVLAVLFPSS